jgi:hypothetical protein
MWWLEYVYAVILQIALMREKLWARAGPGERWFAISPPET